MKYITRSLAALITLAIAASSAQAVAPMRHRAQPPKPLDPTAAAIKQMATVDAVSLWMSSYYKEPKPELLVPALLLVDKNGLLQGGSSAPMQAFASRVFAQNPDKLKDWFGKLGLLSDGGKTVVLTSIWWSNSKESKELLDSISSSLPEKSKAEFHKQIDSTPPEVEKMDIDSPDVLDMLWGAFCATGDTKYVKRLMTTLLWGRTDSKDLPKMLIANAARWSLLSNINQHEVVKQFCLETEKSDKELKPYLEALLTEAAKVAKDEKDKQAAEKQSVAKNETTHKGKREHADENGPNDKQMLGAKSNELDGASSNSGASAPAPVSTAPAETKAATSDVNMTSPSTADESKNVTTDAPKAATTDAAGTTTTDAAKAATTDAAGTTTPDAAAKAVSSDGAGTVTTDPTKTVTTGAGAGASPNASPTPSSPADSSKN